MRTTISPPRIVNGINTEALAQVMDAVREDPAKGRLAFRVATDWQGQTKSLARAVEHHARTDARR